MKGLAGGEPLGKSHLDTALRFKLKRFGEQLVSELPQNSLEIQVVLVVGKVPKEYVY